MRKCQLRRARSCRRSAESPSPPRRVPLLAAGRGNRTAAVPQAAGPASGASSTLAEQTARNKVECREIVRTDPCHRDPRGVGATACFRGGGTRLRSAVTSLRLLSSSPAGAGVLSGFDEETPISAGASLVLLVLVGLRHPRCLVQGHERRFGHCLRREC